MDRIGGKYQIKNKIGNGSFGQVYKGVNILTDQDVAIKMESLKQKHQQLQYESKIYKILDGGMGIMKMHWIGIENDQNAMVLDLLGPSLDDLFNFCGKKFSLKTVLMIADQLISRIEYIHNKNFLHRDVKPENFLLGRNSQENLIYIIDFGLAKKYKDCRTGMHIPFKTGKSLIGTARYCSINSHHGYEQGRRDDLEAIGFILIYFMQGSLPWQGQKASNRKDKFDKIYQKKLETSIESLCAGCPNEFLTYFQYCRELEFEDKPDYNYLKNIFRNKFFQIQDKIELIFDWKILENKNIYLKSQIKQSQIIINKQNKISSNKNNEKDTLYLQMDEEDIYESIDDRDKIKFN